MNAMRHTLLLSCAACLFGLTAGFGLTATPLHSQQGGQTQPKDAPKSSAFQVFPLKHADATDLARALQALLADSKEVAVRIVADPRSNVLLISAPTAEEFAAVRNIIEEMDALHSRNQAGPPQISVFPLRFLEPDNVLEQALRLALPQSGPGNFAIDRQRRQVIVAADPNTTKAVEVLLQRLEERVAVRTEPEVQVRVVWLASGPGREPAAQFGKTRY